MNEYIEVLKVLIAFHNTMQKLELSKNIRSLVEGMPGYKGFYQMSQKEQLDLIKKYIDKHIPKFPMELTISFSGDLQIVPAFQSVFNVAYYAMAQYVSASPDYLLHWSAGTGFAYCKSCGNIFIKIGTRQKYFNDPECKLERDGRKSKEKKMKNGCDIPLSLLIFPRIPLLLKRYSFF